MPSIKTWELILGKIIGIEKKVIYDGRNLSNNLQYMLVTKFSHKKLVKSILVLQKRACENTLVFAMDQMFVLPCYKFICRSPITQCDAIWRFVLSDIIRVRLGQEVKVLMRLMILKRRRKTFLFLNRAPRKGRVRMWGHTEKFLSRSQEESAFARNQLSWHLELRLPTPKTIRKQNLVQAT